MHNNEYNVKQTKIQEVQYDNKQEVQIVWNGKTNLIMQRVNEPIIQTI
jgi:hypothetical protein